MVATRNPQRCEKCLSVVLQGVLPLNVHWLKSQCANPDLLLEEVLIVLVGKGAPPTMRALKEQARHSQRDLSVKWYVSSGLTTFTWKPAGGSAQ
jgi:hypothetical protein